MSGFCRIAPPVDKKFPGVIGEPSALKKTWRGPSELKVSTGLVGPPVKGFGYALATSMAATLKALVADEWPSVAPDVGVPRPPRWVSRCRNRGEPENFTMTI